jgi:aryl carrier-like protein
MVQTAMEYQGEIDAEQNLFSFGANSRTIVQLQALIETKTNIVIDLPAIFENPTIEKICRLVEKELEKKGCVKANQNNNNNNEDCCGVAAKKLSKYYSGKAKPYGTFFEQKEFAEIQKGVFISGATGYLGAHVLKEITEKAKAKGVKVHALIRNKAKLEKVFHSYFPSLDFSSFPVEFHFGDITEERLGLSEEEYSELTCSIDCVVHIAALVKHAVLDSTLSHEAINVNGTKNVCKLALAAGAPFHHTSTTGLAGAAIINDNVSFEFTEDCAPQNVSEGNMAANVYVKSKRDAEFALLEDEEVKSVNKRYY